MDYEKMIKENRSQHAIGMKFLEMLLVNREVTEFDGSLTYAELVGRLTLALRDLENRISYLIAEQEKDAGLTRM